MTTEDRDMHERLLQLEFWQDHTEKRLDVLHNDNRQLNEKLTEIAKTMFQIKWIAIGSFGTGVAYSIGVIDFIKGMF